MLLLILTYVIVSLFGLVLGLIIYARWNWGSLEKQGITVVPPEHFLLGSAMLTYQKPGGLVDIENMKKYGTVFGLYEGREAQIFICDADLIRKITTKDIDFFDAKRPLDFSDELFNEMMDFQPKNKWKTMRTLVSPALMSSMRIKNGNPAMRGAIYDYISELKEQLKGENGRLEKFCVTNAIYAMVTDMIARSCYSIHVGKADMNNRFVQLAKTLMEPPANESAWIASYAYAFPFIKRFLPNTIINPEPTKAFCETIKQMMTFRRKQRSDGEGPPNADYLDSFIEWYDKLGCKEYVESGVNEMSILNMGLLVFIGGNDQLSLILGAMLKHISDDPEIEKKVHAEIDQVFKNHNGVLDHESLSDLVYLTACIMEATRLYPFFFRGERLCTKDWEDAEKGIKIKKGDTVQLAIWATHRNPQYYEDPEQFNPERFMPGNKDKIHPYAFVSFGYGPRNCVGQRLAMEMMILLAAHLMKEFRFMKRSDTQLKFIPAGPFFGASEPIYFDLEERV